MMQLLYEREEKDKRCVLPGIALPFGENGNYLVRYFKDTHDIDVEYLEEVKTVPGSGKNNSRIDQLFTVKEDSLEIFDNVKNDIGAEYAIDIVRHGQHRLYNERTFLRYFKRFEDQLRKSGEISNENIYQSIFSKRQ